MSDGLIYADTLSGEEKYFYANQRTTLGINHYRNYLNLSLPLAVANRDVNLLSGTDVANAVKQWLSENPTTVVYQLATPTVETIGYDNYDNVELRLTCYEGATLTYDSNVAVSSTVKYSVSAPLVEGVAAVSEITDMQDMMIVDMACQLAILEMTM